MFFFFHDWGDAAATPSSNRKRTAVHGHRVFLSKFCSLNTHGTLTVQELELAIALCLLHARIACIQLANQRQLPRSAAQPSTMHGLYHSSRVHDQWNLTTLIAHLYWLNINKKRSYSTPKLQITLKDARVLVPSSKPGRRIRRRRGEQGAAGSSF
jgi:hypothetical protein